MKSENGALTDSQQRQWRFTAAIAPLILLGSDTDWPSALICWGIGALLQSSRENRAPQSGSVWHRGLRWAVSVLALGMSMQWLEEFWSFQEGQKWIPIILAGLASVSAAGEIRRNAFCALALMWGTAVLLGSVLISALPEIEPGSLLQFRSGTGREIPLLTVLLLTGAGDRQKQTEGKRILPWAEAGALSMSAAVCTQGAFSGAVAEQLRSPYYELSSSVRLLGKLKRFESFAILGILIGGWMWLSFLLTVGSEEKKKPASVWMGAVLGTVLYLLKLNCSIILLSLVILSEYILPAGLKNKMKKEGKSS